MGDRSNQVTLGTFIATFVYGLLVLRTVHGAGETEAPPFVPHLGVLVAMVLALASLGVLISFIHHVPRSIAAPQVMAQLGTDLTHRIALLFPRRLGDAPDGGLADVAGQLPEDAGIEVCAVGNGYIAHVDVAGLVRRAATCKAVIRLCHRPGDFVCVGDVLATVHGADVDKELRRSIHTAIALAHERTSQQDFLFVVQQLVEIAIRALSPGVNDPYTANSALDWLGSGAIDLGRRAMPSRFRVDPDDVLRVVVPEQIYADFATAMFDRLRPYAAADPTTARHMMATLHRVAVAVEHPPYRTALLEQAVALNDAAQHCLPLERDRIALHAAHARLFDEVAS
jgi:uncharacterized membrane protein